MTKKTTPVAREGEAPTPGSHATKNPTELHLVAKPGETPARTIARTVLDPTALAGNTLARINQGIPDGDINAYVAELQEQARLASTGDLRRSESMLTSHAHTLDAIFHELIARARGEARTGHLQAAETYMRLALKSQSQCRTTVETLAEIKNPPVVYARQANFANGPQQVVNSGDKQFPRPRESEIPPSKQSGYEHELLPHSRASALAGRIDPALEAVGGVNGTKNGRG